MAHAARAGTWAASEALPFGLDPASSRRALELAQLARLRERRWYGQGVALAVVDDGIHVESVRARLRAAPLMEHGAFPIFDAHSSRGRGLMQPFSRLRRSHGSMCAYDACLAAPGCTLLDLPALAPRPIGGRRLDVVLAAYRVVCDLLRARSFRHVVVVNAWQTLAGDERHGLTPEAADHPLHRALCELDAAGADVLFAAPDHHAKRIHGPALHPGVLTVSALSLDGRPFESSVERVHPGAGKPDVSNFQGFLGYELFRGQPDYGTSAATALTAGQLAAIRSAPRARCVRPAELRELLRRSARRGVDASSTAGPGAIDLGQVIEAL